ncbi:MAG: hypothetical protein AB8B93_11975 [Pseudomonadales bacterium]
MLRFVHWLCIFGALLTHPTLASAAVAAANRLPIATHCPTIRTNKGTLVAQYVQDHFPSGADACVIVHFSSSGTAHRELLQIVPFNFCPRGGSYHPRRDAADVCLLTTRPVRNRRSPDSSKPRD